MYYYYSSGTRSLGTWMTSLGWYLVEGASNYDLLIKCLMKFYMLQQLWWNLHMIDVQIRTCTEYWLVGAALYQSWTTQQCCMQRTCCCFHFRSPFDILETVCLALPAASLVAQGVMSFDDVKRGKHVPQVASQGWVEDMTRRNMGADNQC
jgi:hypothetical protein